MAHLLLSAGKSVRVSRRRRRLAATGVIGDPRHASAEHCSQYGDKAPTVTLAANGDDGTNKLGPRMALLRCAPPLLAEARESAAPAIHATSDTHVAMPVQPHDVLVLIPALNEEQTVGGS